MKAKPEDKSRRIPKDKEDIKVTPFGTINKKRDVPDEAPKEEFIEPDPNKKKKKD
ncbi:hypothetical protein LV84_03241 [Algoriphagus ratkowskyi]|uniref:Uncharacterized protein n=1 Tax=Algoriphagus ratkowskyi TaxID=57028 RepID=A0A2W7RCY1_9BACT|nr:hypothetical protein [Algoriphagus ratkowskyi]PZX53517.1 hypothetical protein LV84_03241 [Algoriphagus ratkowskyi]